MEAILNAIKRLNQQRGQIRAKLTIISRFVNDACLETVDQAEVQLRLEQMPELKVQYEKVMLDLLCELDNTDLIDHEAKTADQYAKSEEFDKDWCATVVKLRKLCTVEPVHSESNNIRQITSANVQLPQIKIADFDGAYHQWLPFYNSFKSLIYDNKSLDDVAKLHYLRSCVKGEAFKTIQAITLSPANFYVAWQLLEKRFHNERLIVDDHVRAILNLPDIPKSNHAALSNLLSEVRCHVEALKSLKIPVESWDAILVTIINNKLDYRTRELWSETLETTVPKFTDLLDFLDGRCNFLKGFRESNSNKHERGITQGSPKGYHRGPRVANVSVRHNPTCGYCKLPHGINVCPEFLSLSVTSRIEKATALKLCKNCLRPNHNSSDCKSRWKCRICQKPHHSILHKSDGTSKPDVRSVSASNSAPQPGSQSNSINHCLTESRQVVLSTALVLMADKHGTWVKCRVLLDPGSQLNFLTADFCKRLGLPVEYANAPIAGISGIRSQIKHKTVATIKSRYADKFQISTICCVTDKITQDLPCVTFDKGLAEIPSDIFLADPAFNSRGPIDCLLGAELFWSLLCNEQLKLPNKDLFLTKTYFGWLIGGSLNLKSKLNSLEFCCNVAALDDLQKSITRFWEQEEIADFTRETLWSGEEQACEHLFKTTTTRDAISGRFIVQLPLKHNPAQLGESYSSSLRRFLSLERRFAKDSVFKMNYCAVIREYLDLDHAQLIPEHEVHLKHENVHYLPHHAVYKQTENGRKTRVVFDASNITTNQSSLNSNLMTGPLLQDDLFAILTRFRAHTFVFTTDLVHMYRQILIDDKFTDLQRILWRFHDNEPIQVYKLKRLTFGLASSSFLAIRCVQQLAQDSVDDIPEFPDIVKHQMYVDDILYGHDDLQHAIKTQIQIKTAFAQAGFPLAKWHSNHEAFLSFADKRPIASDARPFDKDSTKTLGMLWVPYSDTFTFQVKPSRIESPLTKRKILSAISQLFDPLGVLAPVIVKAKILMQTLWATGLDWDDEVPRDIREQWEQYCYHLPAVNNISIPRHATVPNAVSIELCAFSDASQKAYGTVIYLRACDTFGNFTTRVLASKSRVCPIKQVTLARLELCGALLSVRLMASIQGCLNLNVTRRFFFSDSTIVLHWLASPANTWQTYVANRVSEIQTSSKPTEWNYTNTKENPADLVSRGLFANQLLNEPLWWGGPEWLSKSQDEWHLRKFDTLSNEPLTDDDFSNEMLEKRKGAFTVSTTCSELEFFTRFSSFDKLQRVVAHWRRYFQNIRLKISKKERITGPLTQSELHDAHNRIVKQIQTREFASEITDLTEKREIKQGKLTRLDPFLDKNGIIRVGGRIKQAEIPYDQKFPIVLPKHHVTRLIIQREHILNLHSGPQLTLTSLRSKYWPLSARNEVRKITRSCVRCFKVEPKLSRQKMGDLPKARVEPARPFLRVTIDYFGPIHVKQGGRRSTRLVKTYGAIFVCMASRAVHFELVGDLTAESFLNAFKRFISRRGNVAEVFSDNGRNFVGGNAELKRVAAMLKSSEFSREFAKHFEAVQWHFMPARSPNFGGLHERSIKSAKLHIKRVLGNASLTFEEMYTLLVRIEALLNSRPLCPLSNDPNDLQALTPSHLLIGELLIAPVEPDLTELPQNRLTRWRRLEQLRQHFWRRWSKEVLAELQCRSKWKHTSAEPVKPGDLVLVSEDNLPPLMWKLGRVLKTYPGPDKLVRVAEIRTSSSIVKRSVRKLAVLPLEE